MTGFIFAVLVIVCVVLGPIFKWIGDFFTLFNGDDRDDIRS